jgi:hypothetical protein
MKFRSGQALFPRNNYGVFPFHPSISSLKKPEMHENTKMLLLMPLSPLSNIFVRCLGKMIPPNPKNGDSPTLPFSKFQHDHKIATRKTVLMICPFIVLPP